MVLSKDLGQLMRLCDACLLQLGGGVVSPLQMLWFDCRSGTSRFLRPHTALRTVAVSGYGGLAS